MNTLWRGRSEVPDLNAAGSVQGRQIESGAGIIGFLPCSDFLRIAKSCAAMLRGFGKKWARQGTTPAPA
jgi:hypothetical protein